MNNKAKALIAIVGAPEMQAKLEQRVAALVSARPALLGEADAGQIVPEHDEPERGFQLQPEPDAGRAEQTG